MSTEFEREERYIVFKVSDLGNSLKGDGIRRLAREYAEHLEQLVKEPLDYVVIEAGWSEYAPTWKVIDVCVTGAQPAPSVPDGWKLVPIEPTTEMLEAGEYTFVPTYTGTPVSSPFAVYRAMLAAAPEARP